MARKYGIDFALKKNASTKPPQYLVFFKSRDADALTAAFREYSGRVVKDKSKEKPSIRKQLVKFIGRISRSARQDFFDSSP